MEGKLSTPSLSSSYYPFLPYLNNLQFPFFPFFGLVSNQRKNCQFETSSGPKSQSVSSSSPTRSSPPPEAKPTPEEEEILSWRVSQNWRGDQKKKHEDYKPNKRSWKKKQPSLKENRNVLPIKIRQMMSFLNREKKSLEIIHKYLQQNNSSPPLNEKRFYAFLKMKKQKVGNYVTISTLKEFLRVQPDKQDLHPIDEQIFYLRLVRVVFRFFVHNLLTVCSLTSTRIESSHKTQHVRVHRELTSFLEKGNYSLGSY